MPKSDKFEEWCHSIGMEETRVVSEDMVSMEVLKECWDYQQSIIDKLDAKIEGRDSCIIAVRDNLCRTSDKLKIALEALDKYTSNPEHWDKSEDEWYANLAKEALEKIAGIK